MAITTLLTDNPRHKTATPSRMRTTRLQRSTVCDCLLFSHYLTGVVVAGTDLWTWGTGWGNVYGFNMSCIGDIALSEPLVDMVEGRQVVTDDAVLKTYDIAHATSADMVMEDAPFTLRAKREDTVHAFVTFFDVQFTQSKVRFTTSPAAKYTHWKQAVLYLADNLSVRAGEKIQGTLSCRPNARNPRDLDIDVKYTFHGAYQETSAEQKYYMR